MKKRTKIKEIILPHKRINFFIMTTIILGIISGSIFLIMLSKTDKNNVVLQISNFFKNISNDNINIGQAFRSSLIINYIFIVIIWILGFSIVGIIINIFLTYLKGFIVGFTISSIFLTYSYKGLLACFLYVFPTQVINLFVIMVVSIYSIMFTKNLLLIIFSKRGNNHLMLKKYFIILMFVIILSFVSSLLEVYVFPRLLKLIIKIYI